MRSSPSGNGRGVWDLARGGHGEALVEAGQEGPQDGVRAGQVGRPCPPQLGHQPVLERHPRPLDPALGLGRGGHDRGDPEFRQAVRSLQPSNSTASSVVRIPASQRLTTWVRCCSFVVKISLSLMRLD